MQRIKRSVLSAGVAALFAACIVIATPVMAQALPSNCTTFVASDGRGYAKCYAGTGYYKVGIACKPIGPFGHFGYGFTALGEWARVGGAYQSVAKCPFGSSNWSPSGNGTYNAWIDQTAERI